MAVFDCAFDRDADSGDRRLRRPCTLRRAAHVSLTCAALAIVGCSPRQISDSGFGAYEVSLASADDELAVTWYDTRHGNAEVYVRSLNAEGHEARPELRLTTTAAESYEPDIALVPGAFAIAWYEKAADGTMRAQLDVWQQEVPAVARQFGGRLGPLLHALSR